MVEIRGQDAVTFFAFVGRIVLVLCGFLPVACGAKGLEVVRCVTPALVQWDDMVNLEKFPNIDAAHNTRAIVAERNLIFETLGDASFHGWWHGTEGVVDCWIIWCVHRRIGYFGQKCVTYYILC